MMIWPVSSVCRYQTGSSVTVDSCNSDQDPIQLHTASKESNSVFGKFGGGHTPFASRKTTEQVLFFT